MCLFIFCWKLLNEWLAGRAACTVTTHFLSWHSRRARHRYSEVGRNFQQESKDESDMLEVGRTAHIPYATQRGWVAHLKGYHP